MSGNITLLILQTSIHGFLELGLYDLPLLLYPSVCRSQTLRRRAAGIRPRAFTYYYWLPNHVLVMTIVVCFALLNPLVIPFALVYFSVQSVIVKHQLIHVYAKTYENNGELILIRIVRYSLDGLLLAHVVFLAFLLVLKETPEAAAIGVLFGLTFITKLILTRLCRAKFAENDRVEDFVYTKQNGEMAPPNADDPERHDVGIEQPRNNTVAGFLPFGTARFWTWKSRGTVPLHYTSVQQKRIVKRPANPFGPESPLHRSHSAPGHLKLDNKRQNSDASRLDYVTASVERRTFADAMAPPLHISNNTPNYDSVNPTNIVTPHVRPHTWDDSPRLDRPYENPYYAAPIDNFLWLPRNPLGVLDLDDSVDLHQALTCEIGAGKIGQWMDEAGEPPESRSIPLVETPGSLSPERNEPDPRPGFPFLPTRRLSGNEKISMSSLLSVRANNVEQEDQVDHSSRPPSIFKKGSYHSDSESRQYIGSHRKQSSVLPSPKPSTGGSGQAAGTQRVDTARPWQTRSKSKIHDPVYEPDVQAQAVFVGSNFSIPLSQREQHLHTSDSPVLVREAVVGEIIAEEQVEALVRLRREEEEQRRAKTPSWWNGWLWSRSQANLSQEGTLENKNEK